jgi:hypothetical protein
MNNKIDLTNPTIDSKDIKMDASNGITIKQGVNYSWESYESFMSNIY